MRVLVCVVPVCLPCHIDQEFAVSFWAQEGGGHVSLDTPTQDFEEAPETLNDFLVKVWITYHSSLAHLALSYLKLWLDQGYDKGMFFDEIRYGRDNKLERYEGDINSSPVDGRINVYRFKVSYICFFEDLYPLVLPKFPVQLAITHIYRNNPACPVL